MDSDAETWKAHLATAMADPPVGPEFADLSVWAVERALSLGRSDRAAALLPLAEYQLNRLRTPARLDALRQAVAAAKP